MSLQIHKNKGETWREAAERYARPYYLQREILEIYDAEVKQGVSEGKAAWDACYEWDVLDYVKDPQ